MPNINHLASFWTQVARLFVVPAEAPAPAQDIGNRAPTDSEERVASLERPSTPLDSEHIGAMYWQSKSGVTISEDILFSIPAFWRAVKIVSGIVASMPIEVISEDAAGIETATKTHPVYRLLNINPSPLYSRFKFLETVVAHVMAHGNFYAIIRSNRIEGRPVSLTIVDRPGEVKAKLNNRGNLIYEIERQSYSADRVLHISNLGWGGIMGFNMPHLHRDNFGLAVANRDYGNTFYANGAHLSGVVKAPGRLTQEAYNRLRSSWENRYGGSANAGKTAILEEGMDYQSIGLNPTDAAFIETKKLTVEDISLITGVPRFLLESGDPTFNNGETYTKQFVNYTILPLCEAIEAEFDRKLFFDDEQGVVTTRFNLKQLLRADTEARGKYIDTLMKWGILNRDEVRRDEGRNPIADGSGEAYYVPMNMVDPTKEPEPGEQLDLFATQPQPNDN